MMQGASTEQLRLEGNAVSSLLPWGPSKVHCTSEGLLANLGLQTQFRVRFLRLFKIVAFGFRGQLRGIQFCQNFAKNNYCTSIY